MKSATSSTKIKRASNAATAALSASSTSLGPSAAATLIIPDVLHISNPLMALPELIIDVEYLTAEDLAAPTLEDGGTAPTSSAASPHLEDEVQGTLQLYQTNANDQPVAEITVLNLEEKKLVTLPYMPQLLALTTLSLRNNRLTSLEWFAGMPSLEVLDVSSNQISSILGQYITNYKTPPLFPNGAKKS